MYDSPKTPIAPLKKASQSVYITDMNCGFSEAGTEFLRTI